MLRPAASLLPTWIAVLAATSASADVTLLSQESSVRVTRAGPRLCDPESDPICQLHLSQGPIDETQEIASSQVGSFDEAVALPGASASQTTSIAAESISGTASIDADSAVEMNEVMGTTQGAQTGSTAETHLVVTFAVDEPTAFTLIGSWSAEAIFSWNLGTVMQLSSDVSTRGEIVCDIDQGQLLDTCSTTDEVVSGLLAPGTYTLAVEADAIGVFGELGGDPFQYGSADYAFELSLTPASLVPGLGLAGRAASIAALAVAALATIGVSARLGRPAHRRPRAS